MPKLKSLELHGYKTFANRTLFEFSDLITVIVGPNGSGKSNIADSIRWVLGEQSYSLLRGKKTEDMIFSGSEQRARSGMASATITFDNHDGWLPIEFSEVAITRRAYRDGQNEYLINGQRMRLKDVSELLAQSGLAERTYTIIGQGLVDAALALRADERRRLFEEAAGIGLYRSRREEALRRLVATQRNIERVQDILIELKPRLRSLNRQAKRAMEFNQIRKDLQVVMREWYGYHWHRAQREQQEAQKFAASQEQELKAIKEEQKKIDLQLSSMREALQESRSHLGQWNQASTKYQSRRETLNLDLAIIEERISSLEVSNHSAQSEYNRLRAESSSQEERINRSTGQLADLEIEIQSLEAHISDVQAEYEIRKQEYSTFEQDYLNTRQKMVQLIEQQSKNQIRLSEREILLDNDKKALVEIENQINQLHDEHSKIQSEIHAADEMLDQARIAKEAEEKQYQEQVDNIIHVDDTVGQVELKLAKLMSEISGTQAHIDVIDQAEFNLIGYSDGTQSLIEASRKSELIGIKGVLSSHLALDEEYEMATAAALGDFMDAVIIDSDPEQAINHLAAQMKRGVLLPTTMLSSDDFFNIPEITDLNGVIGKLSRVVSGKTEYGGFLNILLGDVILIEDRKYAKTVINRIKQLNLPEHHSKIRLVTLAGELFYVLGPIITGGLKNDRKQQTLLNRSRQKKELIGKKNLLIGEKEDMDKELSRLREEYRKLSEAGELIKQKRIAALDEYEYAMAEVKKLQHREQQIYQSMQWHIQQQEKLQINKENNEVVVKELKEKLILDKRSEDEYRSILDEKAGVLKEFKFDKTESHLARLNTDLAVMNQAYEDARKRLKDLEMVHNQSIQAINNLQGRMQTNSAHMNQLRETLETKQAEKSEIELQLEEITQKLSPTQLSIADLEQDQLRYQSVESQILQQVIAAEHKFAQASIVAAKKQEAMESLRHRIEDDFGIVDFEYSEGISGPTPLPFEGFVNELPIIHELSPDLEGTINLQRAQLRRIGPVNPEAEAEYREISERFNFLTDQIDDLQKAEKDVRNVIAELDEIMEREFCKTFELVAVEFKNIFTRLFSGGSANLLLTDLDDISNAGIEIEAKLPGRRMQGLSLLSGGERSLTATALVFALLKVSPTPFCLLDEVDAMLDEANLVRFRELLQELSGNTQFVVVTHNRNTVQSADFIYGVTMGRDSVSQVVSLKPDEYILEPAQG